MFLVDLIKNFIRKITNKNEELKFFPIQSEKNNENINNYSFLKNIRVYETSNSDQSYKLKEFMEGLKENPDLIENLSDDRLDKLISYYEKIIAEKEATIKKLKQQNS